MSAEDEYVARVRDVAVRHLVPIAPVHGAVNRPLVKAIGDHGLLQDVIDGTATQLCLLRETLATVSTEAETALALQGLGSSPIVLHGNAATKRRWLPGVGAGDVVAGVRAERGRRGLGRGSPCPAGGTGR